MDELIRILREGRHSLVIAADEIRTFDGRGVSDLFQLVSKRTDWLKGAKVADAIVGKAAASLMDLASVREVYAEVLSQAGLETLLKARIKVAYGRLVPFIINRRGDGMCPLETLCSDCTTSAECFGRIQSFIERQTKTNNL